MRIELIRCASRATAWRRAPWAAVTARADGGFWAFESMGDYTTWKGQK